MTGRLALGLCQEWASERAAALCCFVSKLPVACRTDTACDFLLGSRTQIDLYPRSRGPCLVYKPAWLSLWLWRDTDWRGADFARSNDRPHTTVSFTASRSSDRRFLHELWNISASVVSDCHLWLCDLTRLSHGARRRPVSTSAKLPRQ